MKGLPQKQNVIQRDDFIKIIQSAIQLKHYRFAAEMVDQWLSSYPKDIVISYYKALLLFVANPSSVASHQEAIKLLEDICQKDAEYTDAVFLLFNISTSLKNPVADSFKEIYYVLSGKSESLSQIWSRSLYKARFYLNTGNFEEAEQLIQETLKIVLPSPKTAKSINNLDALLSAVTHIQILYRKVKQNSLADTPSLLSLVDFYHNIWDKNLVFKLIQADLLMEGGRSDNAVNILHQTASEDISGEIAERCFGKNHPYLSLWTRDISIKIETSIPASIAAQLGWNQLPNPTDFPSVDKSLFSELNTSYDIPPSYETEEQNQQSVENLSYTTDDDLITALDEIAKNLRAPLPSHTDARYPVYLILSSKQHLKKQYGEDGFKRIDESLVKLAEFTNQLPGWNAPILCNVTPRCCKGNKTLRATDRGLSNYL
jgi:tetratricopeptide (TPR) repeat protein